MSKSKVFVWSLQRVSELLIAAAAVFLLTSYLDHREEEREQSEFESIEPTDWFEINEIYVPNHRVGENPLVIYDRTIKTDFRGYWVAEVQRRDPLRWGEENSFPACVGSGTADYETTDMLDDGEVTWRWFLGRDCQIPPGQYRIKLSVDMRHPEYERLKNTEAMSNVFTVSG